ncbi:hypothetical protein TSOC_003160 [Tetrabaena socialis]|uniref:Uncharacterized protein n=1 Tax=Tetrabaena socialis TaxID=47790 RepID=A0A2J8ACA8_9CHLO|nr:hypothetical protein TSOC_003160 [Tetrabaena socialis]|eukprot:PNH10146.1 hypothetical protein TSOC_003160 [Tetrabaena socialis]
MALALPLRFGSRARQLLVDSADVLPGLPVRTSRRLNAYEAVRQARSSLQGLTVLKPAPEFRLSDQAARVSGFNESYYPGDIGLEDQDMSLLQPYDIASYVPGMQCDVWPDSREIPIEQRTLLNMGIGFPFESQPWLKFRMPMALGQTAWAFAPGGLVYNWNANFTPSGCRAANETFDSGCVSAASFSVRDLYQSLPSSLTGTAFSSIYMRCWTYVNRGFKTGAMQARNNGGDKTIYAFLGAQSIFRSDAIEGLRGPYQQASISANRTSLAGHYQLLAMGGWARGRAGRRALGDSAWSPPQVGPAGLQADVYPYNATARYETLGATATTAGLAGTIVHNLTGTTPLGAALLSDAGLAGAAAGPAEAAGQRRYVRAQGFLKSPTPAADPGAGGEGGGLAVWVLRVRDGEGQGIAISMGNVTVRNGVEFPARTVRETAVEIALPAGFVPTFVTVRSERPGPEVLYDVVLTDPTDPAAEPLPVDASRWHSLAEAAGGADEGAW